jgi:hypothetical protein
MPHLHRVCKVYNRLIFIDDLKLSDEKVACIRHFERRGLSLHMPIGIRALEDLRAQGIMPSDDLQD